MNPEYSYYLENKNVIEKNNDSIWTVQWPLAQLRIGRSTDIVDWKESFHRTLEYVKTEKPEWLL